MTSTPRLLKERMRMTTYFVIALIPLVIFQIGQLPEHSVGYGLMRLLGYPLILLAVLGRSYCTLFIGGRKNDEVVAQGPYSIVRNPLYVFSFAGVVGVGLVSASPILLGVLLAAFFVYYPKVVAAEEAFLENKLGEPYRAYKARVPRWVPNRALWQLPESVEANPKLVLKTMLDASVFFAPLVAFELVALVHAAWAN